MQAGVKVKSGLRGCVARGAHGDETGEEEQVREGVERVLMSVKKTTALGAHRRS